MRKIFLDCGTHLGEGLTYFSKLHQMDKTWEIHCFEPNPNLHDHLRLNIMNNSEDFNITLHPAAVVGPGAPSTVTLNMQPGATPEGNIDRGNPTGGGSTVLPPAILKEGVLDDYQQVTVPTIDFHSFLHELVKENIGTPESPNGFDRGKCFIILKLDVEGEEYNILRALIESGYSSVMSYIYVEFHGRFFKEDMRSEEVRLVGELFQQGVVSIPHW